jgi:hypothetical protein
VGPLYERIERRHETIMQWLAQRPTTSSWAVNGWSACQCHSASVLIEPDAKPFSIAYLGSVDQIAKDWGLMKVDRIDDSRTLFLVEPVTMAKSLFSKGTLGGFNGVPVVDLWQAAVDVVSDPDRGIEQAEAVADLLWPHRG